MRYFTHEQTVPTTLSMQHMFLDGDVIFEQVYFHKWCTVVKVYCVVCISK